MPATTLAFVFTILASTVWPPQIERWRPLIMVVTRSYNVDPDLIAAMVFTESNGDAGALRYEEHTQTYSVGLMQINSFPGRPSVEELLDPRFNLGYGARILRQIRNEQADDLRDALAAYNCGWVRLRAGTCGSRGGYHYADDVIRKCREFGGCVWRPRPRRY